MTPEEQRIAIAEACGWKIVHRLTFLGLDPSDGLQDRIPAYLSDLNAMAEAEKILTDDQQWDWQNHMTKILPREPHFKALIFRLTTASAAQRAECFLRCRNLWTETPT